MTEVLVPPCGEPIYTAEANENALDINPENIVSPYRTVEYTLGVGEKSARTAARLGKLWKAGQIIRVVMQGGTIIKRRIVCQVAAQWMKWAHIKFEFVDGPFGDIIITFNENPRASWSFVGVDSKAVEKKGKPPRRTHSTAPSMNLGFDLEGNPAYWEGTCLHEFGHALGLIHEHLSPDAKNVIHYDEKAVLAHFMGPPNYWTKEQTKLNVLNFVSWQQLEPWKTGFDEDSIMLYAVLQELTTDTYEHKRNNVLSRKDKAQIRMYYPRDNADKTYDENTEDKPYPVEWVTYGIGQWAQTDWDSLKGSSAPEWVCSIWDRKTQPPPQWLQARDPIGASNYRGSIPPSKTTTPATGIPGSLYHPGLGGKYQTPKGQNSIYRNQRVDTFLTEMVRPYTEDRKQTSGTFEFPIPPLDVPTLAVGINYVDVEGDCCRVNTYIDKVSTTEYNVNMLTWNNTILHAGGCSWFDVPSAKDAAVSGVPNHQIETGDWLPAENRPRVEKKINFSKTYGKPPQVLVWFKYFDMVAGKNGIDAYCVSAHPENITTTGFTLTLLNPNNTVHWGIGMTWLSFDSECSHMDSGMFMNGTAGNKNVLLPSNTGGTVQINKTFKNLPTVVACVNSISIGKRVRFKATVKALSKKELAWEVDTWGDSQMYGCGGFWLAHDF